MTDIVLRMKALPDLTNEQAWAVVTEGAKEIERLRAALKPFAELADSYSACFGDGLQLSCEESNNGDSTYAFTLGDLRAALAALHPTPR